MMNPSALDAVGSRRLPVQGGVGVAPRAIARSHRGRLRRGVSLIEVLAVIAIVGILLAVLLPAIQSVRESARRATCGNNQRQVIKAIQQHEAACSVYPPQMGDPGRFSLRIAFGTLYFHLLPFVDQMPMYEASVVLRNDASVRTTLGDSVFGPGLGDRLHTHDCRFVVLGQVVPAYRCPSDASADYSLPAIPFGRSNSASNFQIFGGKGGGIDQTGGLAWQTGVWHYDAEGRKSSADISDGLSSTLALAEKFSTCNSVRGGTMRGGCTWGRYNRFDFWQPTFAADSNHLGAQAMFQVNPLPFTFPGPCNPAVPQTPHAGGVMNVAFLDGSVRKVSGDMRPAVWWALCTPSGGESTDEFDEGFVN